jgi:hypothetical protein
VALERDGYLFDVALLEEHLGAAVPVHGEPSDLRTRLVAMGGAGLRELDQRLFAGERPRAAHVTAESTMFLPPFDPVGGAHLHVDLSDGRAVVALAREVRGHFAFVPTRRATPVVVRAGLGVVLGEDVAGASEREVRAAIFGTTSACFLGGGVASVVFGAVTLAGPVLVTTQELGVRDAVPTLTVSGRAVVLPAVDDLGARVESAIAALSREVPLSAGDLLSFAWPHAPVEVALHEQISTALPRLPALVVTAV